MTAKTGGVLLFIIGMIVTFGSMMALSVDTEEYPFKDQVRLMWNDLIEQVTSIRWLLVIPFVIGIVLILLGSMMMVTD